MATTSLILRFGSIHNAAWQWSGEGQETDNRFSIEEMRVMQDYIDIYNFNAKYSDDY